MKKIIIITLSICLILTTVFACNAEEEISEDTLKCQINILIARQENAHMMAEAARALGYPEENIIIMTAKDEWQQAEKDLKRLKEKLNNLIEAKEKQWNKRKEEYPTATTIWLYLKDLGYNDYVCAGILGNMMAEVGGHTLKINPNLGGNGYYGICQWSEFFSKDNRIKGDLTEQLEYLKDDIEYELNTFGYLYKKDFKYDDFLKLTNEKAAAFAFAVCYERCAKEYRKIRESNAEKALKYFTN